MNLTGLAPSELIIAAIAIPLFAAVLIPFFHRIPNLREAVTLIAAALLWATVIDLTPHIAAGARPEAVNLDIVAGFGIAFKVEPLGMTATRPPLIAPVAAPAVAWNSFVSKIRLSANPGVAAPVIGSNPPLSGNGEGK